MKDEKVTSVEWMTECDQLDRGVKVMSGMFGTKALAMEATVRRGLLEFFAAEAMWVAPGALGLKTPGVASEANLLVTKTPATQVL